MPSGKEELFNELEEIIERLRSATGGYRTIDELAYREFLRGWQQGTLLDGIVERLEKDKHAKARLGEWLVEDFQARRGRMRHIFIESGSTLAYFVKHLAIAYDNQEIEQADRPRVLTNNFLAQLGLFGICNVAVTPGELRRRYLAHVPFHYGIRVPEDSEPLPLIADDAAITDRLAFVQVDEAVSATDVIYLTSSTFGFIVGPLTGTRDNAIFKYCLFNNRARRPIRFCIAESKVFRAPVYRWDKAPLEAQGDARYTIRDHIEKRCFLVFELPTPKTIETHSFALDVAALMDPLETASKPDDRGVRSAPRELALRPDRTSSLLQAPPILGAYRTWHQFLDSQPPGNVELVIGCKGENAIQSLCDAVNEANAVLDVIGSRRKYERRTDEVPPHILHLRVVSK